MGNSVPSILIPHPAPKELPDLVEDDPVADGGLPTGLHVTQLVVVAKVKDLEWKYSFFKWETEGCVVEKK